MADQTSEVADLPPYRAVLVVDAKGFGSNTDPNQEFLAHAIPEAVKQAFERVGLQQVWRDALFPHNSGDGLGIGFDTRHLPAVIPRLFDMLQEVLTEQISDCARAAGTCACGCARVSTSARFASPTREARPEWWDKR